PGKSIVAFNFGLFEDEEEGGYAMYLLGSKNYDENDDSWASEEDYAPEENYFPLNSDEFFKLDGEEVQEKVVTIISRFVRSDAFNNSFLRNAKAITTGFDDGELVRIR
ncbi:MAG: hypothetical protein LPK19_00025, partial [Hymenobacteraceae bacterium]|nr:hypothetical protein [Hymenobacteraceae bacterium]MDX5394558.1 hypothetical protein [Hymenobacteraceae bacterium]MDX5510579.1 hypothetical protein [Hymenobacteraceae bacterium]